MSRPKGSLNKSTLKKLQNNIIISDTVTIKTGKRGRPKGSTNKNKDKSILVIHSEKEIPIIPKEKNQNELTLWEINNHTKIARFIPMNIYKSIQRNKNDILIMDKDNYLFLIRTDSKYFQELSTSKYSRQ